MSIRSKNQFQLSGVLLGLSICLSSALASPMGYVETIRENDPGTGGGDNPARNLYFPSGVSVSNDGNNVYFSASLDGALTAFSRNQQTGKLTEIDVELQSNGVDGLASVNDVIVAPDGNHVYTIGNGDNGSGAIIESTILGFTRNIDGTLTQVSKIQNKDIVANLAADGFSKLAFSPDSNYIYVSNTNGVELVIFQRSSLTGVLTFVQSIDSDRFGSTATDELIAARNLAVSPDGKNIYMVGSGDGGPTEEGDVVVMSRDATTGYVTGMEVHFNLVDGITDMEDPNDVVVSPDGNHVYVVNRGSGSVTVFARAQDGSLTYQSSEQYIDNSTGSNVDVLFTPTRIAINSTGNLLYVGSRIVETVSIFRRDTTDGSITPIGFEKNGLRNVILGGVVDMDLSPDGKFLYIATDQVVDGVTVFDLTTDLVIDKTANSATVATGAPLSYSITATNNGASDATDVVITDTLPVDVTFLNASVTAPGGTCGLVGNIVTCLIDRIATGSAEQVTIDITAPATDMTISNTASATADQVEANDLDNSDSVSTTVGNTTTPPDLSTGSLGLLTLVMFSLLGVFRSRR